MPARKILKYLSDHNVAYRLIPHRPTYTAQDTASVAHVDAASLAKTVIVLVGEKMAMVVLSAQEKVDLESLRHSLHDQSVKMASEQQFVSHFPGIEPGAMPPFGNLYDMPVYIDILLTKRTRIVFNAGTHTELAEIDYADFKRLVRPIELNLSQPHATHA